MSDVETIIDKLRKLRAHAESAQKIGNEAEAQAFAAKVQELLSKYKLSMGQIEYEARDHRDPVAEERVDWVKHGFKRKRQRVAWVEILAGVVAQAYYCRILVHPGSNTITFVGREQDRKMAEFMLVTLVRFLDGDGKYYSGLAGQEYVKFYHQCQEEGDVTRSRGFREAFLRGFITRLHQRFGEELRRVEKSAPTTSTAIVRLSTALKEVDKYMEKYKGRAASVHMNRSNAEGYRRGRDAADRVNLSPKVVERTGPDHKQLK